MNRKQKRSLIEIIVTAGLLILCIVLKKLVLKPTDGFSWQALCLFLVPYFLIGWRVLRKAGKNIAHGQVFDENFLMALATVGALAIGEYPEAVFVMLFYRIGELFEEIAVGKSRASISSLMAIRPDSANLERDGTVTEVSPEEVAVGDIIQVRPGEKIPLDGTVLEGTTSLDTVALTGESVPRDATVGDAVISGCVNMSGLLKVRTTKEFGESTVSKILELVENSSSRKSRSEAFISKFARVYTPAVCYSALALAVLPPVVRLITGLDAQWEQWIYRALSFLVVSCPCALVISIPLSFFAGIGGASKEGVLIKGSNYLETLSQVKTVVFDKTGTLTQGVFEVSAVHHTPIEQEKLLEYAALAECASSHPISKSLQRAYGKEIDRSRVTDIEEISGHGVIAKVDGVQVAAGNDKLMEQLNIPYQSCRSIGTIIHMALDGKYAGHIVISDIVKPHSKQAIANLKHAGVEKTVMLTGDSCSAAEKIAQQLGITEVHAQVLPEDKHSHIEALKKQGRCVIMVGDGINDAPALAAADVSVAMSDASDIAKETADITIRDAELTELAVLRMLSERLMERINSNYRFILTFNTALLALGFFGVITPSMSALLHNGSTIAICVKSMTPLLRGDDKAM